MLFRMGADRQLVRARLRHGDDFNEPLCRSSLGIATDEPLDRAPAAGRRVYVFHNARWDAAAWRVAEEEIAVFDLLHARYPKSDAAKRTRYWYDGGSL